MLTRRVLAKCDGAESSCLERIPRVVELDGVFAAGLQRLRKVDEDRVELALILELDRANENLLDLQVFEIQLDARIVAQHLEPSPIPTVKPTAITRTPPAMNLSLPISDVPASAL
jgi:acetolactate synthase regulatory subunit